MMEYQRIKWQKYLYALYNVDLLNCWNEKDKKCTIKIQTFFQICLNFPLKKKWKQGTFCLKKITHYPFKIWTDNSVLCFLCSQSDKVAVARCGIHDNVFAALLLYSDNLQVLEAGIGAVACLADVGKNYIALIFYFLRLLFCANSSSLDTSTSMLLFIKVHLWDVDAEVQ